MFKCRKHGYCLTKICPKCKETAEEIINKFSIDDKYGKYRRKEKWDKIGN